MMKTDGPFRTCVYIGAMLARDRFKKKSLIKMTKNKTEQKTYIDENSVGTQNRDRGKLSFTKRRSVKVL